ncbi:hypothetical protein D7X33_41950 [Butyricicoccus sp. 1XD8-22]|nr:hypothetical protein D7X33_41950 [Butyricicoccus sp. 1XD8-22]
MKSLFQNDKIEVNYVGEDMNKCEHCKSNEVKVYFNGSIESIYLCIDCYNKIMSEELGVELEQLIESFSVKDYQGISRTFSVERRITPAGICLEATENLMFGYKFSVYGELTSKQTELVNQLMAKTRKGVAKQQVELNVFPNGQEYHSIIDDQFTGLIEYNEHSNESPLVIIDGKPFTWEQIGKMVMAYEGFQMKLTMYDATDEVE